VLSTRQAAFDRWNHARTDTLDRARERVHSAAITRQPLDVRSAALILGFGFTGAVLAVAAGARLPSLGDPTIISSTTWTVLLVVTVGLALSFTPARRLEAAGASQLGYVAPTCCSPPSRPGQPGRC
jgi:uncharacterized membrane protein